MPEWCVSLDARGEVTSIMAADATYRSGYNFLDEELLKAFPVGRMFRDSDSLAVRESVRNFYGKTTYTSWGERKADETFHFMTMANDELGAFANLRRWLDERGDG